MQSIDLLGLVSVVILNLGWGLQVSKVLKTERVRDLSFPFLVVTFVCFITLQSYTVYVQNWVYAVGNSIGMTFVGILLLLKLRFEKNRK